ncbi:MAG: formate--tetrahydrofolate ligase [Bacteroidia bacterium]|jgi:formate--tetrahydrofolate ligase|nr:formate--tetrahydrofolate ligase [Bacteroidia bacterium]
MKSDIEISREINLKPIQEIGSHLGITSDSLIPYGNHKAKLPLSLLNPNKINNSNLILVTAISPTKAGVGKTVTTVSASLGLNKIGKKAIAALREPSLGPVFGMKGGAAGGGYAQVLPMEDINLHFTGDFHAITTANNTIAALLDNYQYNHLNSDKALKQITWKRVLDVNDRSLRFITTGLGGRTNGIPQETGFDITPASEIMAALCLSENLADLQERIERIILGYKIDNSPFTVKDLGVGGAITILLKDAILPNLVQTTEHTPAIIHGGPFANIAHGCNSVIATKMALSLADYVVTEAGFGSDLGAEKFLDIKCRIAALQPKATVLVVTTQSIKMHAGLEGDDTKKPNMEALKTGLPNLIRHIENLHGFGQSIVVSLNKFHFDVTEEIEFLRTTCEQLGTAFAVNEAFAKGGNGAIELANKIVHTVEHAPSKPIQFCYELTDGIEQKIEKIASKIYRANKVEFSSKCKTVLARIKKNQLTNLPVCIAKTQYSFTDNADIFGAPAEHTLHVQDLVINAGAGFIVAVCGDIMRMPGLPKEPAANGMSFVNGVIEGLS